MTHEVHVIARVGDAIDDPELVGKLVAGAFWQATPGRTGLAYANPDTGARASFEPLTTGS